MSGSQTAGGRNYIQIDGAKMLKGLWHPSTLLLLAANSLPILGVLFWHWDVFVLLVLYWMETAVIGFWTILRIALAPPGSMGPLLINGRPSNSRVAMTAFFLVHSGMFMGVHMVFLWSLFSGAWSLTVHSPTDFFRRLVVATDMWFPLLVLFAVRGFSFLFHVLKPDFVVRIERSLRLPVSPPMPDDMGTIIGAFYGRIIIMHITILGSAFLTQVFKADIAPLIIMVVLKTAADVGMHLFLDFGKLQKTSQTVSAVSSP